MDQSATPNDPTVIAGDPGVSRLQVVIAGVPGGQETIYSPPGDSSLKTRYLTIRHLRFKAGTKFGIHLSGRHEDITLEDLEVTPDDFPPSPGICCRMDGEESAALIRVRHAQNFTKKITVIDSRFTAPSSYTEDGISGVKASTMFIQATNTLIRRVESSHFLGAFAGEISNDSIVEDCIISDTTCSDFDGCVSSYNDLRVTIRRNVFHSFRPSETFPAVKVRRLDLIQPAASVIAYNNTFIGKPGTSTGAAEIGMGWPITGATTGESVFINNLLLELGNDAMATGYPVLMRQCAGAGTMLDYNGYWNNSGGRTFNNEPDPDCQGPFESNSMTVNPQLNSAWQPSVNNVVCAAGDPAYFAWDGDRSSPYLGAKPCRTGSGGGQGGSCGPGEFCYEDP